MGLSDQIKENCEKEIAKKKVGNNKYGIILILLCIAIAAAVIVDRTTNEEPNEQNKEETKTLTADQIQSIAHNHNTIIIKHGLPKHNLILITEEGKLSQYPNMIKMNEEQRKLVRKYIEN